MLVVLNAPLISSATRRGGHLVQQLDEELSAPAALTPGGMKMPRNITYSTSTFFLAGLDVGPGLRSGDLVAVL
jgi:hypothetical protein